MSHGALGPLGEPDIWSYLRVLRAELPGTIGTELTSERARSLFDMAMALLDHLIVRDGSLSDALSDRARREQHAIEEIAAAAGDPKTASSTLSQEGAEKSITEILGRLSGRDERTRRAVLEKLRQFAIGEKLFLEHLGAAEAAVAAQSVPHSSDAASITADRIQAYLQPFARDGKSLSVSAVGSPLGGYSKDVFVVHLAGDGRPADSIVIRRDLPKGPLEGSVLNEAGILTAMHAAGVPVAEPLWVETDPTHFGGPAIVLRFVAGAPPTDYRAKVHAGDMTGYVRQLARIMGAIHAVDPVSAGVDRAVAGRPIRDLILALIDDFDGQWRRRREAVNPVIAASLAWMRANVPTGKLPPVVVHGDCSLRNLLFANGKATAMLDWETWHIGDPAEDLAYCREEVEAALPWCEFMQEYREAGGAGVDEDRLRFWSMWKYLRGTITSISMLNAVADVRADIRTAFGGIFFTRFCLAKTAERLASLCEPH
jgi:aminoglycoside phosphotransferase (APT) family kinase protein